MARIYPLFSSSKGNSTFIGTPKAGVLIDAGVSYSRLVEALNCSGIDISAVKAVLVTHEHSDHIKGIPILTKRTGVPVFAQKLTLEKLVSGGLVHSYSDAEEICGAREIYGMEITPFDTPHDTPQSCGYRIITDDGKCLAVCTDLGKITPLVAESLRGCDIVLLEANYDEKMLAEGSYPYYLKARIKSDNGHLSNSDCACQVEKLLLEGTTRIILGHLSQENNTRSIAEKTILERLSRFSRNKDYILEIAPVQTVGEYVAV